MFNVLEEVLCKICVRILIILGFQDYFFQIMRNLDIFLCSAHTPYCLRDPAQQYVVGYMIENAILSTARFVVMIGCTISVAIR